MDLYNTTTLTEKQKQEIIALWNTEYPIKLALASLHAFNEYLHTLSDKQHLLLVDLEDRVKGWLVYFKRDQEPCFAMLLDASLQGQGWGSKFLNRAKANHSELNGWVIDNNKTLKKNGQPYKSPIGFYRKNGFAIREDVKFDNKGIQGIKVTWKST